MFLRWTATIILICCSASFSAAAPRVQSSGAEMRPVILAGSVGDPTAKWRHPKDVYSEFTRLDPRDCARYPHNPECAELETGGAPIGSKKYFTEPEVDGGPVRRNYPSARTPQRSVPVRRSAGRAEFPLRDIGEQDERYLSGMIAQLLIATFEGQAAPQTGLVNVLHQLRHGEVGGVMIRADNVTSANQLASLSKLLASESPRTPLILIERTGASSAGSLPKPGFSPIPSPREIGDKGDALEAFSIYQNMAKELGASGVSMNIGPLVDVCRGDSPGRDDLCFGDTPTHAASFASAFIFAHDEQKVLTAMRFRPTGASLPSVEMLNLVMNRKEPDALFINLDATGGVVTENIADAQKALRRTGFGGVIIHKRSDVLTPVQTAEALVTTLNSGGDMLLFTPSSDWSLGPVADSLKLASDQDLINRTRIREAFEYVYRMNWRRRQWELRESGDSVDATSSIYRRPVP